MIRSSMNALAIWHELRLECSRGPELRLVLSQSLRLIEMWATCPSPHKQASHPEKEPLPPRKSPSLGMISSPSTSTSKKSLRLTRPVLDLWRNHPQVFLNAGAGPDPGVALLRWRSATIHVASPRSGPGMNRSVALPRIPAFLVPTTALIARFARQLGGGSGADRALQ